MKVVLQRVVSASVRVDSNTVAKIGHGLLVLVGVGIEDTEAHAGKLAEKILRLKVFDEADSDVRWKRNIQDVKGEILCVSQFTLHAVTRKGSKPDFHKSQKGHIAESVFNEVVTLLQQHVGMERVKVGVFGAMMQVESINDGPVTLIIDTDT